jgi:uncharacterized protein YcfJ
MMKKIVIVSALALAAGSGFAQEVARVVSTTPVIQQVAVPRRVCTTEQVAVQGQKSGAGAVMGAIAGGAAGNAVGQGNGKAAATVIGLIGGAMLGDHIEGAPAAQVQNVEHCSTQSFMENRTLGYTVVYEYAGRRYSAQFPQDPGPTVQLQISPVGAVSSLAPAVDTAYARPRRY